MIKTFLITRPATFHFIWWDLLADKNLHLTSFKLCVSLPYCLVFNAGCSCSRMYNVRCLKWFNSSVVCIANSQGNICIAQKWSFIFTHKHLGKNFIGLAEQYGMSIVWHVPYLKIQISATQKIQRMALILSFHFSSHCSSTWGEERKRSGQESCWARKRPMRHWCLLTLSWLFPTTDTLPPVPRSPHCPSWPSPSIFPWI